MRNLLLTTAVALPMTFGAAFAQEAEPATDPAMEQTETAPMETEGTDTMADPAMENADADMEDADEAAAAASAAEKVEQQQAENEWRVDWITGTSVTSPDGNAIGDINDLIVDSETGEMKAAIIGVGGFLGIGEKQIALPWTDLTINSDAQEITTDLTEEEADAAPEYVFRDQEAAGDMAAEGDMTADPAATDTMATEPAAEPMAEEGVAGGEPIATEDTMEAEHGEDHMETDMDGDMDGDETTMETEEETAPAN